MAKNNLCGRSRMTHRESAGLLILYHLVPQLLPGGPLPDDALNIVGRDHSFETPRNFAAGSVDMLGCCEAMKAISQTLLEATESCKCVPPNLSARSKMHQHGATLLYSYSALTLPSSRACDKLT